MNKQNLKTAVVLGSICAVAAILLSLCNMVTKPVIDAYELDAKLKARQEVSCGLAVGDEKIVGENGVNVCCPLYDQSRNLAGYVLELSDHGYGGTVNVTASYDVDGKIMAVKFGANSETPGVGKRYENPSKLEMFVGKGTSSPVPANKKALPSNESAIVSGATVTFLGISRALSNGNSYIKNMKGAN